MNTTKIAFRAEIDKKVTPYIVKPSSITIDFENRINPKIIQRKARHRRIETTLRYDHTDDDMVLNHFKERDLNMDNLNYSDKQRLLFERYLKHEIDLETLKLGLETIDAETQRKDYQGIGYA